MLTLSLMKLRNPLKDFTQIPNQCITDQRIVGMAFNVLCYLLSKPDWWDFHVRQIRKNLWISEHIRIRCKQQLKKAWYLEQKKERLKNGKFARTIVLMPKLTIPKKTMYGKTMYDKFMDISNTKYNNTESINTESNIHQNKFDVVSSLFWISKQQIEEWFEHKKSLDRIIYLCEAIEEISSYWWIEPVRNKDTINTTDILLKSFKIEDIKEYCELNDVFDLSEDYQELVRSDYYLPYLMDI